MDKIIDLTDFVLREVCFIKGYIEEVDTAAAEIIEASTDSAARVKALTIVKANRELLARSNAVYEYANTIYRIREEENESAKD